MSSQSPILKLRSFERRISNSVATQWLTEMGVPDVINPILGETYIELNEMQYKSLGRSGEKVAELRRFPAIFRGIQPSFSACQTAWRRRQSGANLSLPKFPANREF
jgi:hypothetical protein